MSCDALVSHVKPEIDESTKKKELPAEMFSADIIASLAAYSLT